MLLVVIVIYGGATGTGDAEERFVPECLGHTLEQAPGSLKRHDIELDFMGRFTLGDLNSDGLPEFVVANRKRIAAYDVCGNRLWSRPADTNWDYPRHYFWNWTSYGFIGDADGDGANEYLHIGADWRTVYVREGLTGEVKRKILLPPGQWMYVLLAQRGGEEGETGTRVIATNAAYHSDIYVAAYDARSSRTQLEWSYHGPKSRVGTFAYAPPQAVNLDAEDGDELIFGTVALSESGEELWAYNTWPLGHGGMHTQNTLDIDPDAPGLESVISIYQPRKRRYPALISYSNESRPNEHWRTSSPHKNKHPHQHTVGDFDTSSPGLEIVARNGNGFDHWMVNAKGKIIRPNLRIDPGWQRSGEIVVGVEWDDRPGTELLYIERHVSRAEKPRLVVTSTHTNRRLTPVFHGGDGGPIDWYGVTKNPYSINGPYEGGAHPVDVFGDGREEIVAWGAGKISIFYNSGHAGVPKRWGDASYMKQHETQETLVQRLQSPVNHDKRAHIVRSRP
jgi:hypothetical protein